MIETWLPVLGYERIYEVSDLGRVRGVDRKTRDGRFYKGRARKITLDPRRGYALVTLYKDGGAEWRHVHRLVLEAFVGARPPGSQGCHGNGNPSDNRLANLRWDTPKANCADRELHGRTARGERHWRVRAAIENRA